MEFDIYTYGGGGYLVELFTALRLLTFTDDWTGLLRVGGLLAILWIALQTLRNEPRGVDLAYFVRVALAYFALLVPRADVIVNDLIAPPPSGPVTVAGVPLGVAALAHLSSSIGRGLTSLYETHISVPGDLQFGTNGMLFGSSLIERGSDLRFSDALFAHDMNAWLVNCGFWQVTRGIVNEDELIKSEDIWGLLSANASTLRFVKLQTINPGTGDTFWSCRDGALNLSGRWAIEETRAATIWGRVLWPWKDLATARADMLASADGAYNYLATVSRTSSQLIQQNIMINAVKQALGDYASTADASAVAVNVAQVQAEAAQRSTFQVTGRMATRLLPIAHNVLEAVAYGLFPIVAFALMLPATGAVLLYYGKVLIWLQLWAPVYAIINSVMTWYGQYKNATASLLLDASANTLALETVGGLHSVNADLLAVAGYMIILCVSVAWMLVSAAAVSGTALVSGLISPTQSAASSASAAAASGNINLGHLSTDTSARNNFSENKLDTNIGNSSGGHAVQTASGGVMSSFGHGSSGAAFKVGGYMPELGTSVNGTQAVSQGAQTQSQRAFAASASSAAEAATSTAAALTQTAGYERAHAHSTASGTHTGTSRSGGTSSDAEQVLQESSKWGQQHSLNESQSAAIRALAGTGVGTGDWSPVQIKAASEITGTSGAQTASILNSAAEANRSSGWSQRAETALRAAQDTKMDAGEESRNSGLAGVRAALDHAEQSRQTSAAQFHESQAYSDLASRVRNNSVSVGGNFAREFQDWLAQQPGSNGQPMGMTGVAAATKDQARMMAYGQQFGELKAAQILSAQGVTAPAGPEAVSGFYGTAAERVQKDGEGVTAQGNSNLGAVRGQAQASGVHPESKVKDSATGPANAILSGAGDAVGAAQTKLTAAVAAKEQDTEQRIGFGGRHLAAEAARNAGATLAAVPGAKPLPGSPLGIGPEPFHGTPQPLSEVSPMFQSSPVVALNTNTPAQVVPESWAQNGSERPTLHVPGTLDAATDTNQLVPRDMRAATGTSGRK